MRLNTLFTTGLIVTLVISLMCCLKRQKKFLKFRTPDGRVPWGVIDMYLLIFSIFFIPTHLYPLVKGWVSGLNLLLTNPVHITPEGYIEDGNPMKSDFFFCFFLYMCQSIRLSVLDFSLARRLSVCPNIVDISHRYLWDIVYLFVSPSSVKDNSPFRFILLFL